MLRKEYLISKEILPLYTMKVGKRANSNAYYGYANNYDPFHGVYGDLNPKTMLNGDITLLQIVQDTSGNLIIGYSAKKTYINATFRIRRWNNPVWYEKKTVIAPGDEGTAGTGGFLINNSSLIIAEDNQKEIYLYIQLLI